MRDYTDEQLVAIARAAGDQGAYEELVRRHHARLRLYLLKRVDPELVEDVMQETYIKAYFNIAKFQGNSAFSTWLFSVAINEYRQLARKGGIFEKLKARLAGHRVEASFNPTLDIVLDFEKQASLLSGKQYDAFVLHAVYGYSHREIAEQLRLPLGSVKSYLAQAGSLLREGQE